MLIERVWENILETLRGAGLLLLAFAQHVNPYALLLAVVAPILLVYARHEILIRRLRTILDFMQSFKLYGAEDGRGGKYNPSFEFVKSKYVSDIKVRSKDQERLDTIEANPNSQEEDRLKFYISLASRAGSRSSRQIYLSSIGFMFVTYFGMDSLIGAFGCDFRSTANCSEAATISDQMLVVGSLAFAGAFVGALRMLLRCLAVYDLSAFSMLRHTAEIIFTVIFVMLIFRAFPDPFFNVGKLMLPDSVISDLENRQKNSLAQQAALDQNANKTGQEETQKPQITPKPEIQPGLMANPNGGIPWLWFALAPALGLLPASATRFLLIKMQSLISWMKTTDDRFASVSRVTSLDIIDGIDFETRFRLEECGIYDVQNLATYNPVMLHIETPYGIYQAIDWIAQAQLCHIVGQEKFLMFREVNIRTIFDLERAIDSAQSPHAFDNIYASILFAPTDNLKKAAAISQFRFLITDARNVTRQVSVEEYCAWAREQLSARVDDNAAREVIAENNRLFSMAIEHLMVWISDDLHIRRLRRLWIDISSSLGKDAEYFPDSKRVQLEAERRRLADEEEQRKLKAAQDVAGGQFPEQKNGAVEGAPPVLPLDDPGQNEGRDVASPPDNPEADAQVAAGPAAPAAQDAGMGNENAAQDAQALAQRLLAGAEDAATPIDRGPSADQDAKT